MKKSSKVFSKKAKSDFTQISPKFFYLLASVGLDKVTSQLALYLPKLIYKEFIIFPDLNQIAQELNASVEEIVLAQEQLTKLGIMMPLEESRKSWLYNPHLLWYDENFDETYSRESKNWDFLFMNFLREEEMSPT